MESFAKLISETKIEFAPKNKGGILNYNTNLGLLKADGYKEFEETEKPTNGRKYEVTYAERDNKITEVINYLETEVEYENRIALENIELQTSELQQQIDNLDKKRIRAICEPSVKDEATGETWLEYYNLQVAKIRQNIQDLKGTNNDITE